MGTPSLLYSVTFNDVEGRLLQDRRSNISGGFDIITSQYDFSGKPLRVLHRQQKSGVNTRFTRELTKYTYDHAGRWTSMRKKIGANGTERVIVDNAYNELGVLQQKTVGAGLETQESAASPMFLLFLCICHASTSSFIFFIAGMCLFRHWPFNICNFISATLSQLPCLGVYTNSNLSHSLFASFGSKVS